ncbi:hypothetical protein LK996_09325 [Lysobacter sp. A6]|uniref:Uncharacterized protein n=1 Tax=Noviluteimonas lactosilytica TaxID=2888523 RepID=A0ABS8JI50_9GAMM|nr:hypothetical protein [Lysobacter lactosilyticus]MCC8363274.1 hypothetical protein [Lysobacter lactosilyticus]
MGTKNPNSAGRFRPLPHAAEILKECAAIKTGVPSAAGHWKIGPELDAQEDELSLNELRRLARARRQWVVLLDVRYEAAARRVTARAIAAETELQKLTDARGRGGHIRWSRDEQRKKALKIIDRHVSDGTWKERTHQEISDEIRAELGIKEERGSMFGADWVGDRLRERECRKRPAGAGGHKST